MTPAWPGAAGFLTDHVADLLAHGFAQLTLEGGIGRGEGFGQVAEIMGLTTLIATVGQDRGHGRYQALLLVAEHGQDGPFEVLQRLQKGFERGLILLAEPATAPRQATGEFTDEPNLGLAPLRRQAVEGHDQAALLLGNLGEASPVLPLVAGQEGQIDLLIQIAHVGHRDADPGGQCSVNLTVRGAGLLPPPANVDDDIVAIGGASRREALPLCGEQAQARADTRGVRAAPRSTRHREDVIEHLHGLIPCQIVARHEEVATMGTGQEFRVIDEALFRV